MLKLGLYFFTWTYWLILIPVYVCLAPICMISSGLFDWIVSWLEQDQTFTLMAILVAEWAVSATLIFQLMIDRTGKSIFFYEFVFFLVCINFILIGISYSLIQRANILEQFAAKICTTLFLILVAQKMKIHIGQEQPCTICYQEINQDSLKLKCSHTFHEQCLWKWITIKVTCPKCSKHFGFI